MSNFQTQPQQPRSSGGGFSSLPQGAQQAITGVLGIGIVAALVFCTAMFLGSSTGKTIFFESTKTLIFALLMIGIFAYAFMWAKVSISTSPSLFELAVPAVGLAVYFAAILVFSYVWSFAMSGAASVINMTLN